MNGKNGPTKESFVKYVKKKFTLICSVGAFLDLCCWKGELKTGPMRQQKWTTFLL